MKSSVIGMIIPSASRSCLFLEAFLHRFQQAWDCRLSMFRTSDVPSLPYLAISRSAACASGICILNENFSIASEAGMPLRIMALRFLISSDKLLFSSNAFVHIEIAFGSCIPDSRSVEIRHRNNGISLIRSSLLRSTSDLISNPPSSNIAAVNKSAKRGLFPSDKSIEADRIRNTVPVKSCFLRYCS